MRLYCWAVLASLLGSCLGCKGGGNKEVVEEEGEATVLVMSGGLTRDPTHMVEAFFTEANSSSSFCFLPDLPADRNFNTIDWVGGRLIVCGGDVMAAQRFGLSCLFLTKVEDWQGWVELRPTGQEKVSLQQRRISHLSWNSPEGLLLLGGVGISNSTTEWVPLEDPKPPQDGDEEVAPTPAAPPFSLHHPVQDACGIPLGETFIVTGGFHSKREVTMYNLTGDYWDLPGLNSGRWSHGCGSYTRGEAGQQTVLVVAGGIDPDFTALTSTEVLLLGEWEEWQFVEDLPGPLEHLSSAKVGNQIYISGGESVYSPGMVEYRDQHSILVWEDQEEDEDEDVEGAWVEAGRLKIGRNFHGMVAVEEIFVNQYCQD